MFISSEHSHQTVHILFIILIYLHILFITTVHIIFIIRISYLNKPIRFFRIFKKAIPLTHNKYLSLLYFCLMVKTDYSVMYWQGQTMIARSLTLGKASWILSELVCSMQNSKRKSRKTSRNFSQWLIHQRKTEVEGAHGTPVFLNFSCVVCGHEKFEFNSQFSALILWYISYIMKIYKQTLVFTILQYNAPRNPYTISSFCHLQLL